jgi:hypothetical protein
MPGAGRPLRNPPDVGLLVQCIYGEHSCSDGNRPGKQIKREAGQGGGNHNACSPNSFDQNHRPDHDKIPFPLSAFGIVSRGTLQQAPIVKERSSSRLRPAARLHW